MIDSKEEKWLKKALKECFDNKDYKTDKDRRLLEGFGMLIRNMVRSLKEELVEIRAL